MSSERSKSGRRILAGSAVILLLATTAVLLHQPPETPVSAVPPVPPAVSATSPIHASAHDRVPLRPLPVSLATTSHEWTTGNASDPEVIQRIAHNPDEALRMIEENDRIHRRQLVYRNETADVVVQRARAAGEAVRQLTLPGLDGRELDFEIHHADLDPSGQSGSFAGRLSGQPDSMVVLSFRRGREAFSVSSPSENLHLQADPREPGELIVKSIDPATYIQGGCGNPDHNH